MSTHTTDGRQTRSTGTRRATSSGRRTSASADTETTDAILSGSHGSGSHGSESHGSESHGPRSGSANPRTPRSGSPETRTADPRSTPGRPRAAADRATRRNSVKFRLPVLGTVSLPASDELAYLGGVGALALVGVIEWPVAVALGAGHALVAKHRGKVLREFGEALEEA